MTASTSPAVGRPRQLARPRGTPAPTTHRLLRKSTWRRLATLAATWLFGFPVALAIRLVSPFVLIRVGEIGVSRIGHILPAADLYLCDLAEMRGRRPIDLIYFTGSSVNPAAEAMVRKKIRPRNWAQFIAGPNAWLPGAARHRIDVRYFDTNGIRHRIGVRFELDPKWVEEGDAWLESLGVARDQPIILIANRDPAHLDNVHPSMDWSYHGYRDSNIEMMIPMAEHFAAKGVAVIRMGADVAQPLECQSPLVIDYAMHHRSPQRDLYLGARCQFLVCTTSGVSELALAFRKPYGAINAAPLSTVLEIGDSPVHILNGLWMPKVYWSREKKRPLTFREIYDAGLEAVYDNRAFEEAGIELVENTGEDILEFAKELEDRRTGRFRLTPQDRDLYARFWEIVGHYPAPANPTPISRYFLQRHADLLR